MCILGVTYLVNDLPRETVGFPSQILCDPGVGILRGILCGFGTRILYCVISKWDFMFFFGTRILELGSCEVLEPGSWSWDLVQFWNQDPGVGICT